MVEEMLEKLLKKKLMMQSISNILTEERNLLEAPKTQTVGNDTCNYSNNPFIIYGASGKGKSYWLKKNYLERFNIERYFVFSPHRDE